MYLRTSLCGFVVLYVFFFLLIDTRASWNVRHGFFRGFPKSMICWAHQDPNLMTKVIPNLFCLVFQSVRLNALVALFCNGPSTKPFPGMKDWWLESLNDATADDLFPLRQFIERVWAKFSLLRQTRGSSWWASRFFWRKSLNRLQWRTVRRRDKNERKETRFFPCGNTL